MGMIIYQWALSGWSIEVALGSNGVPFHEHGDFTVSTVMKNLDGARPGKPYVTAKPWWKEGT